MGSVGDVTTTRCARASSRPWSAELLSRDRFRTPAEARRPVRLHRGLVQSAPAPLRAGLPVPGAFERRLMAPALAPRKPSAPIDAHGDRPSPLPPSRTRLRRAALRSSILDRVSGWTKASSAQWRTMCRARTQALKPSTKTEAASISRHGVISAGAPTPVLACATSRRLRHPRFLTSATAPLLERHTGKGL